jgi:predicted membrane chloride channel (bestrophin family)
LTHCQDFALHIERDILNSYDYSTDTLLLSTLHPWDRVNVGACLSYGGMISNFGRRLMAHQNRVSKDLARFLLDLGYSPLAAKNIRAAMMLHDIGYWMTVRRQKKKPCKNAIRVLERRCSSLFAVNLMGFGIILTLKSAML